MLRFNRVFTILLLLALILSACQPITAQPVQAQATPAANKEFILRYFATLNQDKEAAKAEFMTDQVLKDHIDMFEASFPGYQLTADSMIAEGNMVFVQTTFTGTHKGDLNGIAPTGKVVTLSIALTYRIENGTIVDHWMLFDQMSLLQQLGVMPTQ